MSRVRPSRVLGALALIALGGVLNGKSGLMVGFGVVVTLVGGARPRALVGLAGALFALTPLSMLRQGLVSADQLQLQLVSRYTLTNNLAFAGFAYLVVGVLLQVHDDDRAAPADAAAPAPPPGPVARTAGLFDRPALTDLAALAAELDLPAASDPRGARALPDEPDEPDEPAVQGEPDEPRVPVEPLDLDELVSSFDPDDHEEPHDDLTRIEPTRDDLGDVDPMARGFKALEQALRDAHLTSDTPPTEPPSTEKPDPT